MALVVRATPGIAGTILLQPAPSPNIPAAPGQKQAEGNLKAFTSGDAVPSPEDDKRG